MPGKMFFQQAMEEHISSPPSLQKSALHRMIAKGNAIPGQPPFAPEVPAKRIVLDQSYTSVEHENLIRTGQGENQGQAGAKNGPPRNAPQRKSQCTGQSAGQSTDWPEQAGSKQRVAPGAAYPFIGTGKGPLVEHLIGPATREHAHDPTSHAADPRSQGSKDKPITHAIVQTIKQAAHARDHRHDTPKKNPCQRHAFLQILLPMIAHLLPGPDHRFSQLNGDADFWPPSRLESLMVQSSKIDAGDQSIPDP